MSREAERGQVEDNLFQNSENENYQDSQKIINDLILDFKIIIKNDAEQNLKLKRHFFYFCCGVLGMLAITLVCMVDTILKYHIPTDSPTIAVEIVSVVASFVAAFMILPKIIAENLFSSQIQESVVKIVKKQFSSKKSERQ